MRKDNIVKFLLEVGVDADQIVERANWNIYNGKRGLLGI